MNCPYNIEILYIKLNRRDAETQRISPKQRTKSMDSYHCATTPQPK